MRELLGLVVIMSLVIAFLWLAQADCYEKDKLNFVRTNPVWCK